MLQQNASSNSGNSSGWWSTFGKTFLNGVLHGVRQPGQSFSACVDQHNIQSTTFGTVDPGKLLNPVLVQADPIGQFLGRLLLRPFVQMLWPTPEEQRREFEIMQKTDPLRRFVDERGKELAVTV
ncbi:MAG: hypothetical protein WBL63_18410 [Candidatus Acidiferrum sp.]